MPKIKEKSIPRETPPDLLLWEMQFERETRLSFDECINLLQRQNDFQIGDLGPKLKIVITSADANEVHFNMHIGNGLVKSWIIAHLEYTESGMTVGIGKTGVDPSILILFALISMIPVTLLITIQVFAAFVTGAVITAAILTTIYISANNMKRNLINKLEEILR